MKTFTTLTHEQCNQKYIATLTKAEINWLLTLIKNHMVQPDGTVMVSQRAITINNKLWKSIPQ